MAIYVFQLCSNLSITAEFDVDVSYSPGNTLFSYVSGATCWEMTAASGSGPAPSPDLGPYADCTACNTSLNAWEFENCCTFETAYFAITNGDVSTFAAGSIIEYNGECWLFTSNFSAGTSGTLATVNTGDIVGNTCEECLIPCITPTPTQTVTPGYCLCKRGVLNDNNPYSYYDCSNVFIMCSFLIMLIYYEFDRKEAMEFT